MLSQLLVARPPSDSVDVAWLRAWCPDSKGRVGDLEDTLPLHVLEIKMGCPYEEVMMRLCLVGPLMQLHPRVREFMRDRRQHEVCLTLIHKYHAEAGVPPTLLLAGPCYMA